MKHKHYFFSLSLLLLGFILQSHSCHDKKQEALGEKKKDHVSDSLLAAAMNDMNHNVLSADSMRLVDSIRQADSMAKVMDEMRLKWNEDSARMADSLIAAEQAQHPHPPALPVEPRYKEGRAAMEKFIAGNLKYPAAAKAKGITGTVYVDFIVKKDGTLGNVHVRQGLGYGCDEEAVRVVKLMPAWEPGKQNGKAVDMEYNVPVSFKLN